VAGLFLPTAAQPFCDCWKRSEELVQNTPDIPVVIVNTVQGEVDKKGERGRPTTCSNCQSAVRSSCQQIMFESWAGAFLKHVRAADPLYKHQQWISTHPNASAPEVWAGSCLQGVPAAAGFLGGSSSTVDLATAAGFGGLQKNPRFSGLGDVPLSKVTE
jgi:hypothetical protein